MVSPTMKKERPVGTSRPADTEQEYADGTPGHETDEQSRVDPGGCSLRVARDLSHEELRQTEHHHEAQQQGQGQRELESTEAKGTQGPRDEDRRDEAAVAPGAERCGPPRRVGYEEADPRKGSLARLERTIACGEVTLGNGLDMQLGAVSQAW